MPLPLFRTKSSDSQRRPAVFRSSSRDSVSKNNESSLWAMAETVAPQRPQRGFSFQGSYDDVLRQSSQDMDDIMRRFQAVIGLDGNGSHKTPPRASDAALSKL